MDQEVVVLVYHIALVRSISFKMCGITCIPDHPNVIEVQIAFVEARNWEYWASAIASIDLASIMPPISHCEAKRFLRQYVPAPLPTDLRPPLIAA